jgi:hypothetical protein
MLSLRGCLCWKGAEGQEVTTTQRFHCAAVSVGRVRRDRRSQSHNAFVSWLFVLEGCRGTGASCSIVCSITCQLSCASDTAELACCSMRQVSCSVCRRVAIVLDKLRSGHQCGPLRRPLQTGPLAFNSVNLAPHIAFWQSLACARSPYQLDPHCAPLLSMFLGSWVAAAVRTAHILGATFFVT